MVAVAARAAARAQILRIKSKIATPLFHPPPPPCSGMAFVVAVIFLCLVELVSRMSIVASPWLLVESMNTTQALSCSFKFVVSIGEMFCSMRKKRSGVRNL